jgi:hypothetical protein
LERSITAAQKHGRRAGSAIGDSQVQFAVVIEICGHDANWSLTA